MDTAGLFFVLSGYLIGWRLIEPGTRGALSSAPLLLAASSPRTWLGRYHVPGARGVAAMAFSLYLVHKQSFHWVEQHLGEQFEDADLLRLCLMFGAALAAGALLYLLVERPGLLLRKRFLHDAKPGNSTAASVTN